MQPTANALYYGDCLDWMSQWDDQTVDLIYLDPPFNSQADYNMLYGTAPGGAQYRAFADTWAWDHAAAGRCAMFEAAVGRPSHAAIQGLGRTLGPSGMLAYLSYMAERLEHCQRLLKPTGTLYLHCDDTADAYLRVLLDTIFGARGFRNAIIWKRSTRSDGRKFGRTHDTLLAYGRETATWNDIRVPYRPEYVARFYREQDARGRYKRENLTAAGRRSGESGEPWRGYEVSARGRHWAVPKTSPYAAHIEREFIPGYRQIMGIHDRLDMLDAAGLIHWPKQGSGMPMLKRYLDAVEGQRVNDVFDDIRPVSNLAEEYLGYPTQKPVALLERIIEASSNPDDLVLDPFCGCGTTVAAARNLNRRWAGVDISAFAIDVIRERLRDPAVPAHGIPADLAGAEKLATERPFDFEAWAVTRLPGFVPNTRQVADGGVDGRATLWEPPDSMDSRLALAQVKGGRFNLSDLRDFAGVLDREDAALGCYITLDPVTTPAARAEAANRGHVTVDGVSYPRLQLWSVADYFSQRLAVLPHMADPYTGKPLQMRLV